MTDADEVLNEQYWDRFYSHLRRLPPSQFAALVASDIPAGTLVLDIGCGNARDTFFFAGSGFPAVGFDKSPVAIESNAADASFPHLRFVEADAKDMDLKAQIGDARQVCAYARFFLHAIDEVTEEALLTNLTESLPDGSAIYLEYRTLADEGTVKTFSGHYRRYIDHARLVGDMANKGIQIVYEIEGQGLARFGTEDPHVGRIIAVKKALA